MVKIRPQTISCRSIKKRRKKEWIAFSEHQKNFHNLPVEVLANILEHLPKESLVALPLTSEAFRYAVGLIARREWCKSMKHMNETISCLKLALLQTWEPLQNESDRFEICQKIGYERIIEMKLNLIAAIIGDYAFDKDKWKIISPAILKMLFQLDYLRSNVFHCPYFVKDIRPRFLKLYATRIHEFLQIYFTEIEPLLRYNQTNKTDHTQIFNMLTSCQSANSRIVVFHTGGCDYSIVSLFFEVRGLGQRFSIDQFRQYADKDISDVQKLANLKKYFCHIIEHEYSEHLFCQLERIMRLETKIDYPENVLLKEEVLHHLQNAYETFLYKPYYDTEIKKTKFKYKNMNIYRHEISRQREFRLCVSKFVCNMKFCCTRQQLPQIIQWNDDDDISYTDINESYLDVFFEYLKLQNNIFQKNRNIIDNTALNMDVWVSHNESPKSIIVVVNEILVNITNNKVKVKKGANETISRFDGFQCECEDNGISCNIQQSESLLY